jgi:hypothetical protein
MRSRGIRTGTLTRILPKIAAQVGMTYAQKSSTRKTLFKGAPQ